MSDGDKSSLSYERPASGGGISRWQFRLLLALVVANLAITIQSTYAPGTGAAVKKWWADRQATRRVQALYRQAATWTQPGGKVMWEDDPNAAAAFLAGEGYQPVAVPNDAKYNYPYLTTWPPGAGARPPAFPNQLFRHFPVGKDGRLVQSNENYALLLMHAMKSASGQERLVYVYLTCGVDLSGGEIPSPPGVFQGPKEPFSSFARKRFEVNAMPCLPPAGADPPKWLEGDSATLIVGPPDDQYWRVPFDWTPGGDGNPPKVRLRPENQFRFYAGQLDPADQSRFTIDYEVDGTRGKIHGRLRDDGTVELKPDGGTVTGEHWTPPGKG